MVNNKDLIDKAVQFAIDAHKGQVRKLSNLPYYLHPVECGMIALNLTDDVNTICAAILHDTIEDTNTTIDQIEEAFGKRVAELVSSETEPQHEEKSREDSWIERKEYSLHHLKETCDREVKVIWMCDKLSNIRSLFSSYCKYGDDLWNQFHQKDINKQKWYYDTIEEYLSDLKDTGPYKEYSLLKNELFKGK